MSEFEDDEAGTATNGCEATSPLAPGQLTDPPARDGILRDEAMRDGIRLRKSPSAFRTISEVADELHIPQHVLRFWETRFPQVKPLKRGGGRRYYRPDDIALLRSISHLLYIQGYTIKGVQRLLREGGGALADDIPPASDAERREGDAEVEVEVELATAQSPSPTPEQGSSPGAVLVPIAPAVDPLAAAAPGSTGDEGLRAALREVLAELEAIRALIPG